MSTLPKQGNLEGFDSCDLIVILLKIGIKSSIFPHVTLKFDGWPPPPPPPPPKKKKKKIGHLFYTALSFVYHFKAISEFNLELDYQNAKFGSKSMIFFAV